MPVYPDGQPLVPVGTLELQDATVNVLPLQAAPEVVDALSM